MPVHQRILRLHPQRGRNRNPPRPVRLDDWQMIFGLLFKEPDDQLLRALYNQRTQSRPLRPHIMSINIPDYTQAVNSFRKMLFHSSSLDPVLYSKSLMISLSTIFSEFSAKMTSPRKVKRKCCSNSLASSSRANAQI